MAKPNESGADVQFGLAFYAHDTRSKKTYVGGGNIFDSRPFGYQNGVVSRHDIAGIWVAFFSRCQRYRCRQEVIGSDTFTPFASSPILNTSKYSSPGEGSTFFTAERPWSEWRWFKVTISGDQVELAAKAINERFQGTNISENAADYVVSLVLLGNEVAPTGTALNGCPVAFSNAFANFSAYIEQEDGDATRGGRALKADDGATTEVAAVPSPVPPQDPSAVRNNLRRSKGLGDVSQCRFPPPMPNDPAVAMSSSAPSHLKYLGLDGHAGDDAPWVSLGSLGPQRNGSGWSFNTSLLELQKKHGVAMMVDMQGITIPQCRGNATCWRELFIGPNATVGGLWNSSLEVRFNPI